MANRAYLFAKNTIDPKAWRLPASGYYDSRWSIPIGWLFLFSPDDLVRVEVKFQRSSWEELKIAAQKDRAVQNYRQRINLLQHLVDDRLDHEQLTAFVETVSEWRGTYVLLDPQEIFDCFEPQGGHEAALSQTLSAIASPKPSLIRVREVAKVYANLATDDPDDYVGQVLGYTYW